MNLPILIYLAMIAPVLGLLTCWFLIGINCIQSRLEELREYHHSSNGWGGPARLTEEEFETRLTHCLYDRSYSKLFLIGGPGLLICRLFFSKTFFPKPQD